MPSALFHTAVGLLIGMAVLGDVFDRRTAVVIMLATLVPDLDAVIALWIQGAHRVYLHNVFVVLVPALFLLCLRRSQHMHKIRARWPDMERVCWTALLVIAVAGIGLDVVATGANVFYPVHDQFYQVHGTVSYSAQEGLQQTVGDPDAARLGTTEDMYYASGVEALPGSGVQSVTWSVPLFENTLQLLLSLTVFLIAAYRVRDARGGVPMIDAFPVTPIRQTERRR